MNLGLRILVAGSLMFASDAFSMDYSYRDRESSNVEDRRPKAEQPKADSECGVRGQEKDRVRSGVGRSCDDLARHAQAACGSGSDEDMTDEDRRNYYGGFEQINDTETEMKSATGMADLCNNRAEAATGREKMNSGKYGQCRKAIDRCLESCQVTTDCEKKRAQDFQSGGFPHYAAESEGQARQAEQASNRCKKLESKADAFRSAVSAAQRDRTLNNFCRDATSYLTGKPAPQSNTRAGLIGTPDPNRVQFPVQIPLPIPQAGPPAQAQPIRANGSLETQGLASEPALPGWNTFVIEESPQVRPPPSRFPASKD